MGLWGHSDGAAATIVSHQTSHDAKASFAVLNLSLKATSMVPCLLSLVARVILSHRPA